MSKSVIKTVLGAVLLVVECLAFLFLGILCAKKEAQHTHSDMPAPKDLYLTLKEDISFTLYEKDYYFPAGTKFEAYLIFPDGGVGCILPQDDNENHGSTEAIGFSDTASFTSDIFEEQDKIKELTYEAIQQERKDREESIADGVKSSAIEALCWLVLGSGFVFFLSWKKKYKLLYIMEALMLVVTVLIYLGITQIN